VSTAPSRPSQPLLAAVRQTSVDIAWSAPFDGGSTIFEYQIGYSTNPAAPVTNLPHANSPQTITGLLPGTLYYFFIRAHNRYGYSTWSVPASIRTVAGAYVGGPTRLPSGGIMNGGTWKGAVPYVRVGGVWKPAEVWVNSLGTWTRVS
jgi:hypothetical protein